MRTQLFAAEEEPLLLGRQVGQLGDLLLHLSDRGHLGYLRDGLDLPAITYAYENHPAAPGDWFKSVLNAVIRNLGSTALAGNHAAHICYPYLTALRSWLA